MTDSNLLIEIENGVAIVILNRPDVHNAFDDVLITQIITALNQVELNPDVKVVVLTSHGKHFSAGADLNWMKRMAILSEQENRDDAQQLAQLMHTLVLAPVLGILFDARSAGALRSGQVVTHTGPISFSNL